MRPPWTPFIPALVVVACTKGPPPEPPRAQDPGVHLLYKPSGDAEGLLGREVTLAADGSVVAIADTRKPGCHVRAREELADWNNTYDEDAGRVVAIDLGKQEWAKLRVDYDNRLFVHEEITNHRNLHADIEGDCGEIVVTTVMIGTGVREVRRAKSGGAVITGPYDLGKAGGGAWDRVGGRLSWSTAQVWGFRATRPEGTADFDLRIEMPAMLTDGTSFSAHVYAARPLWLVVLYEDALGNFGLVLPNPNHPAPRVQAGQRVELPKLEVFLRYGESRTHEKLIVYGFAHHEDLEDFGPPAGALSEDDQNAYGRGLPARLDAIERSRWTTADFRFVIEALASTGAEP